MPIYSSIGIRASVGRGGRNQQADVATVQERLNELMGHSRQPLKVDGRNGPKTERMIADFQTNVLGLRQPDGRVDPIGKTIAALNDPASEGKWQRMSLAPLPLPPVAGAADARATELLASAAVKANLGGEWETLLREVVALPDNLTMKKFLSALSTADQARGFIEAWKQLRKWGLTAQESRQVIVRIVGLKTGFKGSIDLLEEIGKPASRLGRIVSGLGKGAGLLSNLLILIEVADKFAQGDYLYGTTKLYNHFMSKAIPWAGMIDGLQGLLEAVVGESESAKNSKIFKLIRAADPIGLGAAGVDALTTLILGTIHLIQTGHIDMARLSRLTDRLESGPTKVFAEMGNDLGGSVFEMSQWRRSDWTYAIKQAPGFLLGF